YTIGRAITGTRHSSHRFAFVDGNARWESARLKEAKKEGVVQDESPETSRTQAFFPGVALEELSFQKHGPSATIYKAFSPPDVIEVELGLGLRRTDTHGDWLTPEMINSMKIVRDDAAGHVIFQDTNGHGQLLEYVLDPAQNYALVVFRRHANQTPDAVITEVIASEFKNVNGVPLPMLIALRTHG